MMEIPHAGGCFPLNAIEQLYEGSSRQSRHLRFAHFGSGHHLHGLCDLRSAADRSDSASKISGTVHSQTLLAPDLLPVCTNAISWHTTFHQFHPCLNSSTAFFRLATKSGARFFSFAIRASNSGLRVLK